MSPGMLGTAAEPRAVDSGHPHRSTAIFAVVRCGGPRRLGTAPRRCARPASSHGSLRDLASPASDPGPTEKGAATFEQHHVAFGGACSECGRAHGVDDTGGTCNLRGSDVHAPAAHHRMLDDENDHSAEHGNEHAP